jgi:hypothetical protein
VVVGAFLLGSECLLFFAKYLSPPTMGVEGGRYLARGEEVLTTKEEGAYHHFWKVPPAGSGQESCGGHGTPCYPSFPSSFLTATSTHPILHLWTTFSSHFHLLLEKGLLLFYLPAPASSLNPPGFTFCPSCWSLTPLGAGLQQTPAVLLLL